MVNLRGKVWLLGLLIVALLAGCVDPVPTPVATPLPAEPSPQAQAPDSADTAQSQSAEPTILSTPVTAPTQPPTDQTNPTPNLADWTLLIYMDADNNLDPYAMADLNEIAINALGLQNVNIVVQIDRADELENADLDWTDTRRLVVENAQWVELESLGEIEMGDAEELASFLDWGTHAYPAKQTALIMWGHGSGWLGMSTDNALGADGLTLSNLEAALQAGLANGNAARLDLIGFDACLMGQLDVFAAVQNHASVAVASADLIPGEGWDYAGLLQQLAESTSQDAAQLGSTIVETYQARYAAQQINDVTLAAVDLNKIRSVTDALDRLADVMLSDVAAHAPIIADSRHGGRQLANNYGKTQEQVGAIDFGRFVSILAQLSPDPSLRAAAQNAIVAIENAVLISSHGSDIAFSEGIGLYFPRRSDDYNNRYASATHSNTWAALLKSFYTLDAPAPTLTITSAPEEGSAINAQNPAFIGFELTGKQIEKMALIVGRYEPDGRQLLIEYDRLVPEPTALPDGSQISLWRDGVHADFFVWDTEVTYLTDGSRGDFVVMWPTAPNSTLFSVQGIYHFANGSESVPAALVFDHRTRALNSVWGGEVAAPAQITPQAGDEFQIYRWFIEEDSFITETAASMQVASLSYDNRPVDDGSYLIGFQAESSTGGQTNAFVDLSLDSSNLDVGYRGYLDPYLGYQFLYPDSWIRPIYGEFGSTLLYTSNVSGTHSFQVKLYQSDELAVGDQATPLSAEVIRADALNRWENISLLYEDTTTVAGEIALQTVYGYQSAEGQRTGMFYTFVHDGAGYLVDIDVPATDEAVLIATANKLVESWTFQTVGVGLDPERWTTFQTADESLLIPSGYVYEPLENGWARYRRAQRADTFFAFRRDELSGRSSAELAASWIELAGSGLADVVVGQPSAFPLAGLSWVRHDFSYTDEAGTPVSGFLLTSIGDQEAVLWAESPSDEWDTYAETVLLLASREFRQK